MDDPADAPAGPGPTPSLAALAGRVVALADARAGERVVLGIAGPPGAGKTTLAVALVRSLGPTAVHVPMDGYHLADVALDRLGRRGRKGAPDTFDAGGYAALLQRLRTARETVWAPAFDREIEQPIAGSIPVEPSACIVVTEGNYLLLDVPEWAAARAQCAEVWYCDGEPDLRHDRLVARHERFGKSHAEAVAWTGEVDEANAALVRAGRERADLVITGDVPGAAGPTPPPSPTPPAPPPSPR